MKEVFLYGCEDCGSVIAIEVDKGSVFYVVQCTGCNNNGRYYEKIVIKSRYDMLANYVGSAFVVEEKKDGEKRETNIS